jgi:hypothetical protein
MPLRCPDCIIHYADFPSGTAQKALIINFFTVRFPLYDSSHAEHGRKAGKEHCAPQKIEKEMKILKINTHAAVLGFFLTVMMAPEALADERIFFFGNSYTYYGGGMENAVKALLEEASPNINVEAQRSTGNGAKLPRHLADLDGTNGDTAARQALITGNNTSWDLVVLQDQSAVPAYIYSDLFDDSLAAGTEIHRLIQPTGAVTMFLLTWGRQRGLGPDEFFSDYSKMQQYLTFGYREYQKAANIPVRSFVAPAGLAFQLVYEDTIAAGGTEASSPFSDLYAGDGSHPDRQGTYLSACVIYAAYTGRSVAELKWAPDGIGAERRDYLQSKADEAVFDDDTFYPSRWDLPDFVGLGDILEPTGPSVSPPAAPTTSPSAAPSVVPTPSPSISPSAVPSDSPSVSPSAAPSTIPSTYPSVVVFPSSKPSTALSAAPTTSPSATPSVVPSVAPSISAMPLSPNENPGLSAPAPTFSLLLASAPAPEPAPTFGGFGYFSNTSPTKTTFSFWINLFQKPDSAPDSAPASSSSLFGSFGSFSQEPGEETSPTAASVNPFVSAISGSSGNTGGGTETPTTSPKSKTNIFLLGLGGFP